MAKIDWVAKAAQHRDSICEDVVRDEIGEASIGGVRTAILQNRDVPLARRLRDLFCVCGSYIDGDPYVIMPVSKAPTHVTCIREEV